MKKCVCKYLFLIGSIAVTVYVIKKLMCCCGMDLCECRSKFCDLAKDTGCEAKKLGKDVVKDVKDDLKTAAKDVMCDVKDATKDMKNLATGTMKEVSDMGKGCCNSTTN